MSALINSMGAFMTVILTGAAALIMIGWSKSEDFLQVVWKKWKKNKIRIKIEVIILFIFILYLFYKIRRLVFD